MANSTQDCSYIPLPEQFTYFRTLHCLGTGKSGNSFRPAQISHDIINNFALVVDSLEFVSRIDDEGYGQKFWGNGWPSSPNPGYSTETSYVLEANVTTQGLYKQFKQLLEKDYLYTYPSDRFILGLINNLTKGASEACLISEESEKSYYTLETRLFTYPLRNSSFTNEPDGGILCPENNGADIYINTFLTGQRPVYSDENPYQLEYNFLNAEIAYQYEHRDPSNITMAFFLEGETPNCTYHYYENEACNVYTGTNQTIPLSGEGISRYLFNSYWSEQTIHKPLRFMSGILTDCNAYASTIGIDSPYYGNGKLLQLPEHGIDSNTWSGYTPTSDYVVVPKSKQCQFKSGSSFERPKKLGVDNHHTAYNIAHGDNTMLCQEGYLSDRDVILASVNAGDHACGLFNANNNNIKEIEFELFYCVNVNDPTAALNLVTFAKKLNDMTTGFNTGIPQANHFNSSNPSQQVTIQPQNTYTYNSQITYKSEVIFDEVTMNDSVGNNSQFTGTNTSHITVIPSFIVNGVYYWSGMNSIKYVYSPIVFSGSYLAPYTFTYGSYILGFYDHCLYLIDKASYDAYFYNPGDFINFANNMCAGNGQDQNIYDPFRYAYDYVYSSSRRQGVTSAATVNTIAGLDL